MSLEMRTDLAARQAELVAALVEHASAPPGFDANRIEAAAAALLAKRQRAVVRVWPGVAAALGVRFGECFAAYARAHPLPEGGALADARAFVHFLSAHGEAPDELLVQALRVDLRISSRFWPKLNYLWLQKPRRLIFGVRLPFLGTYMLGRDLPR